jgi:dihydroorotate dehydrogenase
VGVSIGKARDTPLARAVDDYATALRTLYPHGSYFVINVSSPNTVALASLQERAHLHELLGAVRTEIDTLHRTSGGGSARKPFLVKVSPDLTDTALGELLEVCAEHHVDGLVATNTTTSRAGLTSRLEAAIPTAGGLSGAPLADRVRQVVAFIHREAGDRMPVIGVGGIMSASDGQLLLDAGAALVQLYTGLVYRGPRLVRQLARELGPSTVPPVPKPRNPPECRSDSPAVT